MALMIRRFEQFHVLLQLIIFIGLLLITGELLDLIIEMAIDPNYSQLDFGNKSTSSILFEVLVLAPLLETLLIQFLIIELILFFLSEVSWKSLLSILVSGLIFGIMHQYNLGYMIAQTILGWLFGLVYIFYRHNKRLNPFLAVVITHFFYNLVNILNDYILR